ncbi:MAG: hypothetical protein H0V78_09540 [Burkholderiales bacterium]|nr:hypothetical protein [Burkholderiales bacterium]
MASLTADIVLEAMLIHQRFQPSYWEAAIIAASKRTLKKLSHYEQTH